MKNLFTVIILGSAALVGAEDQINTQPRTHVDHFHDAAGHAHNHVHVSPADQTIIKNVQDELSSGLFSKGFQHVSFEVSNGNVTLDGSVDSIENKHKVEDRIKKLDGVKFVNNNLKIAKENGNAYSESQLLDSEKKFPHDTAVTAEDRQLNAQIRDKLSNGWLWNSYETLVVNTNNGVVILTGLIDSADELDKVNEQLKSVEGIKLIKNKLALRDKTK